MKLTKKLLSMLIALTMVFTLAIPAFAAGTGSIKINNAVDGHTYTAYKILELESFKQKDEGADIVEEYLYKVDPAWENFVNGAGASYLSVDANGYVKWIKPEESEETDAAAFAALAIAYAEANKDTITSESVKATSDEVIIPNLELGYYLVDTTLGSLCSLGTTDTVAEISEKNEEPSIKKEFDPTSENTTIAGIGEIVKYKITVTAKESAKNYIVHDKMTNGLTFNNDVEINGLDLTADYTVETENLDDDCSFHIVFTEYYLNKITTSTDIVITYSATINENAVVKDAASNTAQLVYGDDVETEWTPELKTNTLKFAVEKTDGNNGALDGAEFELYDALKDGTKINLVLLDETTNRYRVATDEEAGKDGFKSAIITAGTATIEGLDDAKYYLEEITAPKGYNKLTERKEVDLSDVVDITNVPTSKIVNLSGTELPSTGGIGTTLFYGVGGAMFLGALIMLVTKKRMKD